MMQMKPIGYGKSTLGISFGIFILLGGAGLTTMFLKSGAEFSDVKYFVIGAGVLAFLFIMTDITKNLKNAQNIEHMQKMLKYPAVMGKITEIKKYRDKLSGREEIPVGDYNRYRHLVFRAVITFYDEKSGCEKQILSHFYARDPRRWTKSDQAAVHYSPNGEYWIELDA
jgi:hypothetical protein